MKALEMDVVTSVGTSLLDEVHALVASHEAATGSPGLSEDRLRALDRASTGATSEREPPHLVGVAARHPGRPGLAGWAQVDGIGAGRTPTLEVVAPAELGGAAIDALVDAVLAADAAAGGGPLRWWVHHAGDTDDARAAARGFTLERELLQMRCPLPLPARAAAGPTPTITTRAFRVGYDEAGWLIQNNRAFAGHPEQGQWDLDTVTAREREPWFNPDGFRILEVDGRIAGSCWTKVHRSAEPPLGEIYVIGVDPDFHGRGWGRALTEDGFAWLAAAGLSHGMLYVDAANTAAVTLYTSMGMTVHHVNRAYIAPSVPPG